MIKANLTDVMRRVSDAAESAKRSPDEIRVIAVSKTFGAAKVLEAYEAGARDFGENRVQEAKGKVEELKLTDARWHLIGHLQTNKARLAARIFDMIHSVDSVRLAKMLDESCTVREGRAKLEVLLQINIGDEPQKSGVPAKDALQVVHEMLKFSNIRLTGLMTIPPYCVDKEETRRYYSELRELRDEINASLGENVLTELSMGMSNDYDVAIDEGATHIRVGTAIFGGRDYSNK